MDFFTLWAACAYVAYMTFMEPSEQNRRRAFSLSVFVLFGSLVLLLFVMKEYDPILDFISHWLPFLVLYFDPCTPKGWDPAWIYALFPLWLLYSRFDFRHLFKIYERPYSHFFSRS